MRLHQVGAKYRIQIPLNRTGYGLRVMHLSGGGGILLNANKIGDSCGFNTGVLIGNNNDHGVRPTIGNYIAFGHSAKAFVKFIIGDNVFGKLQ